MHDRVLHTLTIFLFIYAAIFFGMAEYIPLVKMIHQIGATLVFGLWLIALWRSGRGWPITPLDGPLWLLLAAFVLSAALSNDPRISLEYTWGYLVMALTFYFFVDQIRLGRLRWIMEGVFLFAGLLVLVSFLEMLGWYFGWPLGSASGIGWPAVAGFSLPPAFHSAALLVSNPNRTAIYCVLLLPIVAGWALSSRQRDTRWGLSALALGLLITLAFAQSRGGWLALGVVAASALGWAMSAWLLSKWLPAESRMRRSPYVFVAGLLLATLMATVAVMAKVILSKDEIARTDLLLGAIRMFQDHPLLGVGPFQFDAAGYWYANYENSLLLKGAHHAHNLTLHILVEGGIVEFTLITALIVRTFRVWWGKWHRVDTVQRFRLHAIALMVVGVTVNWAAEASVGMRPMIILLAMLAVVVAPSTAIGDRRPTRPPLRSSALLGLSASVILVAQVAFVPIYRGLWKHEEAGRLAKAQDSVQALAAIRAAQQFDPWLDLYILEEAYYLGLAAYEFPARYLDQAIAAHEDALKQVPAWDIGWHNLASLYAQKDQLPRAIEAEQRAANQQPGVADYSFQLARYLTAAGQPDRAQEAFLQALRSSPTLASSDFWTDPAFPERLAILDAAVYHPPEDVKKAANLANHAGRPQLATLLSKRLQPSEREKLLERKAACGGYVCPACYYIPRQEAASSADFIEALHVPQSLPDQAVHTDDPVMAKYFLSAGQNVDVWYFLAAQPNRDTTTISDWLFKAVRQPLDRGPRFSVFAYGIRSPLSTLPQARTPILSPRSYEPWLVLGERLRAAEEWEAALLLYEKILVLDPYDRTAQQQVALLTDRIATNLSVNATLPGN